MRITGIVRNVDNLGRVVIPKEMRRVLDIQEGDQVDMHSNDSGEIILKKYVPSNAYTSKECATDLKAIQSKLTGAAAQIESLKFDSSSNSNGDAIEDVLYMQIDAVDAVIEKLVSGGVVL